MQKLNETILVRNNISNNVYKEDNFKVTNINDVYVKMYEKCVQLSSNSYERKCSLINKSLDNFLDFSSIENLNLEKKSFHKDKSLVSFLDKTNTNKRTQQNQITKQIIFSTLSRTDYNKKINLLFPIQEFVSANNEIINGRYSKTSSQRTKEYAEILLCMKKLRSFYGSIPLKQLTRLLVQAKKSPGYFYKNFFALIERRLDVILFRSGFFKTIVAARQACLHSKISVNSKICNIPSTQIKPGDIISYNKPSLSKEKSSDINTRVVNGYEIDGLRSMKKKSNNKIYDLESSLNLLTKFCAKAISSSIKSSDNTSSKKQEISFASQQNTLLIKNSKRILINFSETNNLVEKHFYFLKNKENCFSEKFNILSDYLYSNKLDFYKNQEKKEIGFLQHNKVGKYQHNKIVNNSLLFENIVDISLKLEEYSPILSLKIQKYISNCFDKEKEIGLKNNKQSFSNKKTTDIKQNFFNLIKKCFITDNLNSVLKKSATHLEISRITNNIIFLYSPQKVILPFHFDIDILLKTLYK